MFRPYMWTIFRLWLDFWISYTGMRGVVWEGGWNVIIPMGTIVPVEESPRTLHAFLYNWSRNLITTWRWPTYRAETCRCYNILLAITDANIAVFDCKYNTPISLLLYKTQRGWRTSQMSHKCLTLYVQSCAPDDGRINRLKHVALLTEIYKLEKRCILLVVLWKYAAHNTKFCLIKAVHCRVHKATYRHHIQITWRRHRLDVPKRRLETTILRCIKSHKSTDLKTERSWKFNGGWRLALFILLFVYYSGILLLKWKSEENIKNFLAEPDSN